MTIPTIGLSSILMRLARYRRLLVFTPIVVGCTAGLVAAFSLPIFTSYARLLPPQTNTATASTLLNQVGGSAALGASALTLKNPSDLYASLFMSRSIQDEVIKRFDLMQHYQEDDMDQLRLLVAKRTRVDVGRDGIITLSYTDKTSERAAQIANGMIDAMYSIGQRLARDEAERRQGFYEILINEAKARLHSADQRLLEREEETGLTRLKGQEEASVAAITELRGMIATRQVDLAKMRQSGTDRHPQVVRMRAELLALQSQLQGLEHVGKIRPENLESADTSRWVRDGKALFVPFKDYPRMRALIEPLRREVEMNNNVIEQLVKARALSRVDESRDLSVIQVLDGAVAPTRRSGPRPLLNAAVGGVIGFLLAALAALFWDLLFTNDLRRERWKNVIHSFSPFHTKNVSATGDNPQALAPGTSAPADKP
jgi:tyrosine-protein kinase Etk/Wzc